MKGDFEFESDWQLFKQRTVEWQERYMGRLLREYAEIISKDTKASERFWELKERINKDKNHIGVVIEKRRIFMIRDVTRLIDDGVIEYDDLEGFSDGFLDRIKRYYDLIGE